MKEYITSCLICNPVKLPHRKEGYMATNQWPCQPLEVTGIDYVVELPKTPRGYGHILVIKTISRNLLNFTLLKVVRLKLLQMT